ncbi:tetratricopeptide repeat protein [Treponema sp.]|uniref:tetratricopeptide repeat protein n=1 Tax=Treponema sp. TaxID=166 RepID=UPI003F12533D
MKFFRKIHIFFLSAFFMFSQHAFAQSDDFSTGESLFKENRAEEAVVYLKSAISTGKFPKAYNYLALCYEKMGLYKESLEVCTEGMKVSGTDKKVLAFNAGNVCFAMEDYSSAEKWYSLAIAANRLYAPPVLNRANAELKQEKFLQSLEDYKLYLDLSPNDRQKPEIERIIALLEGFKKAEEEKLAEEKRLREEAALIQAAMEQQAAQKQIQDEKDRTAELEAKMAEQEARLEQQRAEFERMLQEQKASQEAALKAQREADARKAEEDAARRRKLLEDVAASLQNSETSNMAAGAEGTIDYGYESELE